MKSRYVLKFSLLMLALFTINIANAVNINVGGTISSNTIWNADTVKITSDIIISNGITLTVSAGTYVQAQGSYRIKVNGRILAQGTANNRITFTALSQSVGWKGVRFENTPQTNDSSIIEYCTFSYGKVNTGNPNDKSGGAIFMYNYSKLKILNSIFSNNYASSYGGAIALESNASPIIVNCLVVNNTASSTGGGIDVCSNSNPIIVNTTIAYNSSSRGGGLWTSNMHSAVRNCIIYGNTAPYSPQIYGTPNNVAYCNVENGYSFGSNIIDTIPNFVSPATGAGSAYDGLSADYSLSSTSYLINKGTNTVYNSSIGHFDVVGKFRYDDGNVDLGAYEYISSTEVCGNISSNTTWSGNILLNCDVTVDNGKTLTIQAGTKIIATGHYRIDINGRLLAIGTSDNYITMTAWNHSEGWNGLLFSSVSASNDTSKVEYCKMSYKKNLSTGTYNRGAICLYYSSKVLIRNNIFSNNYTYIGGAIYIYNSNAKIVGNLIVNNQARYYGGGVAIYGSSSYHPSFINNTIAKNKSKYYTSRGGVYCSSGASPVFKNNIIYGNEDRNGGHSADDNFYSAGKNVTYSCVEGSYAGTGNISASPKFKNPTPNAGIGYNIDDYNFSLQPTSPAIDAGYIITTGLNLPTKDLAGKTRKYSAAIDMGAYEDKSSLAVCGTISTDETWDANVININCDVTINSGVTVTIVPGTKVLFNGHNRIYVKGAIQAKGAEGDTIIFTASNTVTGWDGVQIYDVNENANDSSIFSYCKFEYAKRAPASYKLGGGAISDYRSNEIRINNCMFVNNEVLSTNNAYGAAIDIYVSYNNNDGLVVWNNTFKSNTSKFSIISFRNAKISFKNNVAYGNTSIQRAILGLSYTGGNYYNNIFSSNTSHLGTFYAHKEWNSFDLNINNNVIANNESFKGGGVYLNECKPMIYNNTIVNNTTTGALFGGGIYFHGNADANLKSNIIYGNKSAGNVSNQICIDDIAADPKFYNNDIKGGLLAFSGIGSGINYAGVYSDNLDISPLFTAPTSGAGKSFNARVADWSLQQGSALINSGYSNSSSLGMGVSDYLGNTRIFNGRIDIGAIENQNALVSPCTISSNTEWEADTIRITCNVTINPQKILIIKPGTNVLFMGSFEINVKGAIIAEGTVDDKINFIMNDTTGFWDSTSNAGGWRGINFNSIITALNDSSKFEYCTFKYAKASSATYQDRNGAAINIYNSPKISILNCSFSNNFAHSIGGALYIESSNIKFMNNLVCNNTAGKYGGGIYLEDCNIEFNNNTVVNNKAKLYGGLAVKSSELVINNSLFWGNRAWHFANNGYYSQLGFYSSNNSEVYNCNIQYGKNKVAQGLAIATYQNNLNINPEFVNPSASYGYKYDGLGANWSISTSSPMLNKGKYGVKSTVVDIAGNTRIIADTLDIGAYEVQISQNFIDVQPTDKNICVGSPNVFAAHASVTAQYQWQKNGNIIPGATSNIFSRNTIALSDTGSYNCIISNEFGSISTDTVTLSVMVSPTIISSPTATNECLNSSVTFTANADGTKPITYKWYNTNGLLQTTTGTTSVQPYVIGNDTLVNSSQSYPAPFANYFWGAKQQFLILASELTSMGIIAGDITTLGFEVAALNSCPSLSNFELKIGSTTASAMTDNWVTGLTTVYSAASYQPTLGWNNFGLSSAYTWNGTSNIVVEVCSNNSGWITNGNAAVKYSNTSFNSTLFFKQDNSSVCSYTGSGVKTVKRPNIRLIANGSSIVTTSTYSINSISANDASNYYMIASNTCGSAQTSGAILGINYKPTLTQISSVDDICEGVNYPYVTAASQGTAPIAYQWFQNGDTIQNATSFSYTITNSDTADAGLYLCKATNMCGTDSTNTSVLTVNEKPKINSQSASTLDICENQSITMYISATGSGSLTYQWYKGGNVISGATNNSYTINSVSTSDASTYKCKVSNSCTGSTPIESANITLNVNVSPTITAQTSTIDICANSAANFSVTATGTATLTYQWYDASGSIASATNNTYAIGSASTSDAGNFYCVVSNTCGTTNSNQIPLTVNSTPSITTQPSALIKCENQSALFDVQATGTATLTYQWYKGGSQISGASASSLLISPVALSDAANYYCKVINGCGNAQSNTVALTVNSNVSITAQSSSQTLCEGASPTFSVTTLGTSPITYQWYDDDGVVAGAVNATYNLTSIDTGDAGNYYCVVTNTCTSTTSNAITLSVNEAPSVVSAPSSTIVCENLSAVFNVSTNGSAPITYQWYNGNGAITGATNASYLIAQVSTSDAGSYYVKATNSCGNVSSNPATLTVNTGVSISSQSSSATVCSGVSNSFSITATGTAPITYQWYKDNAAIATATNNTYAINSVTTSDGADYYVIATNTCNTAQSNNMSLTVNQGPAISMHPVSTTVCEGASSQFAVIASGTAPMTYQWYDGSGAVSGATNTSYLIAPVSTSDAGSYYVKATNSCGNVSSNPATLTVNTGVSLSSQSSSAIVCSGVSNSFSITATGTTPITYQWYKDNTAIATATNNTYAINSVITSDGADYYVIATNTCNTAQSNNMSLTVNQGPAITSQPISTTVCTGASSQLNVIASGTAPLTYQWFKTAAISNATNSMYLISQTVSTDAGTYYVKVTNSCGVATSNNASLTVNTSPSILSQSAGLTRCEGTSALFTLQATGTAPLTYQWYTDTGMVAGANANSYTIAAVTSANVGNYNCMVSNTCGSITSSNKALIINTAPVINSQSMDDTICEGISSVLQVGASGTNPMTYQWYKTTTAITGALNSYYTIPSIDTNDAATYYAVVTNACGNAQSNNITLTVNRLATILMQSGDSSRCENENMTFSVAVNGSSPITYQWYKGTTPISGANNTAYGLTNVAMSDAGYYHVNISNMCNSLSSSYKLLSVHANPVINLGNDTTFCDGGNLSLTPGYGYQCQWSNGSYNNQINVTSTGSYFVNVTDQYGCSGVSDTVDVNVLLPFANQAICIVGVDTMTNKNMVVWDKAINGAISSFNIYKESAVSNVWNLIGNRPYDSLSVFVDLTSTPNVKPERYAITVVDSCGNESARSISHRTMHLTVNAGTTANTWNLLWNAYEGFMPSTYRIYRADSTMKFVKIDSIAGSSSYTYLWTDNAAPSGTIHYMVEIIHPTGGCNPSKANTNYNSARSNRANNGIASTTALIPDFIADVHNGHAPMIVHFYDQTSNGSVDTWFWNFGDGGNSTQENPVYQYDSAGVYHVSLTVTNSIGTQSVIKQSFIDVLPNGIYSVHNDFDVQIFPNPYKETTNIAYALTSHEKVNIKIFNSLGALVTVVVDENQNAGSYKYSFSAKEHGFSAGVYYLRMTIGDKVVTKRLVEVR